MTRIEEFKLELKELLKKYKCSINTKDRHWESPLIIVNFVSGEKLNLGTWVTYNKGN